MSKWPCMLVLLTRMKLNHSKWKNWQKAMTLVTKYNSPFFVWVQYELHNIYWIWFGVCSNSSAGFLWNTNYTYCPPPKMETLKRQKQKNICVTFKSYGSWAFSRPCPLPSEWSLSRSPLLRWCGSTRGRAHRGGTTRPPAAWALRSGWCLTWCPKTLCCFVCWWILWPYLSKWWISRDNQWA